MRVRVVDASAIAALLYGEAEAERMVGRLIGNRLMAPSILSYELASICITKCRREPDQAGKHRASFAGRGTLCIEELPVDHDEVRALARAEGLTHSDAAYLWLSRTLDVPLITLDKALVRAAG